MSKDLEDQLDEFDSLVGDALDLGFDDDEKEIVRRANENKPSDEDEVEEKPEKVTSAPASKPRLRDDIRAQLELAASAKPDEKDPDEEKYKDFDIEKWAELVKSDPRAAFEMSTEHVLKMSEPGKRIKGLEKRLERADNERRISVAEAFIDANADYPHQDAEVNAFMERALTNLQLPYTKRNLESVWKQAKDAGYIEGLEVPKKKELQESKGSKKASKSSTPPRTPASRTTGSMDGEDTGGDAFLRWAEKIDLDNFDESIEKARDRGLTHPGSLSRALQRTGAIDG